jgi:hypothetical protein
MNENMKNLTQHELVKGLTLELYDVISKYEESLLLPTAVGILEMLKNDLMRHGFQETLEVMVKEKTNE